MGTCLGALKKTTEENQNRKQTENDPKEPHPAQRSQTDNIYTLDTRELIHQLYTGCMLILLAKQLESRFSLKMV